MDSPPDQTSDAALDAPIWSPTPEFLRTTNVAWLMGRVGVQTYAELHKWSVQCRDRYWAAVLERLGIRFAQPPALVLDLVEGIERPRWLPGARLNLVESCFQAPAESDALIWQCEGGAMERMSVAELRALAGRVAGALQRRGIQPGDGVAMAMPMTAESVAIYLGVLWAGAVVIGIADSFRAPAISARLALAPAKVIFTQDVVRRGGKELPLYERIVEAAAPAAVVLAGAGELRGPLRAGDVGWAEFLEGATAPPVVLREPSDHLNILFSSGTTGEPKAIPWTQTTPLKCGADAHFHQNVQPGDVVVWPTNLGWMMGPWLIFGALLNRAAIGLFDGAPTGREFCCFVQDAKATMLGVVPSLVRAWREQRAAEGLDWSALKVFSSTGECSHADDMRWLVAQAGGRPMIEYCGGTEVGGAYITGTLALPCHAGIFNTPTLGLDLVLLDAEGREAPAGEVFLLPPSVGFSNELLNRDHRQVYYEGTPPGPHGETLRRHGDELEIVPGCGWRALGRADDTMNLGGIKVSSAEIERALKKVEGVVETAAIAVSHGGPSALVIYAVCAGREVAALTRAMQLAIREELNPLFKIHEVVVVESLPRTESNKVMRRVLRDRYTKRA